MYVHTYSYIKCELLQITEIYHKRDSHKCASTIARYLRNVFLVLFSAILRFTIHACSRLQRDKIDILLAVQPVTVKSPRRHRSAAGRAATCNRAICSFIRYTARARSCILSSRSTSSLSSALRIPEIAFFIDCTSIDCTIRSWVSFITYARNGYVKYRVYIISL